MINGLAPKKATTSNELPTAFTVWFTGLSGAGKSTLARVLAEHLKAAALDYELIDGDEIRTELCRDLGYSKEDRDENVRRIGYVARILNRHGVIAIVAAIAPYREARRGVRSSIPRFVEVYMDCPLETLIERDTKGLYRRALTGTLGHFTGVSDPYEPPLQPDVCLNSAERTPDENLAVLLEKLVYLGFMPRRLASRPSQSPAEQAVRA